MPNENEIDIAGLRERIQNKRDSFETSIAMGLDEMLSLLALAEIGRAAVEAEERNVDPDYTYEEWEEAKDKLKIMAYAYLARKDG